MVYGPKWLALTLGASLALAACQAVPPTTPPRTNGPSSAPSVSGTASPAASPSSSLGDALRAAIDVDDILADLGRLQAIADANAGTRAVGTAGYDASAEFVAGELRSAGFEVDLQPVTIPVFLQTAPGVISIAAAGVPALEDVRDFKAMVYSASGDVTAKVFALGFDPIAQPGDRNGRGCDAADWSAVPRGVIVLVQPGPCRRHDVVVLAQGAGVLAVVTTYADWPRDGVLRPTLIEPDDIDIPVIGGTHAVGLALAQAALDGSLVHLVSATTVMRAAVMNVIGETPTGDPGNVLLVGGHLDSAIDGPGINDNGSGTMTVLEIARELAALANENASGAVAPWKVRVAFWAGEELGLFGSAAYVRTLDATAIASIRAYLNFDMLGSPNGVRAVYDPAGTLRERESAVVARLFSGALEAEGRTWRPESVGGGSDQFPFDQAGIPVGGLFSGATELKTAEEATRFGGRAGQPDDACYHLACDTTANIDPVLLEQLARTAAWVVGRLASGEAALR